MFGAGESSCSARTVIHRHCPIVGSITYPLDSLLFISIHYCTPVRPSPDTNLHPDTSSRALRTSGCQQATHGFTERSISNGETINCTVCTTLLLFFNPLNPELNPIYYLLALLGAHHFLHVSRIRVKLLTFRLLMSYKYAAPILDVSRSHTTTHHSR